MDEPAEHAAGADRARGAGNGRREWRREVQAAMASGPVVAADVFGEDPFQVASGEHER